MRLMKYQEMLLFHQAEQELLKEKIKGFVDMHRKYPDILDESRLLDEISDDLVRERMQQLRDKSQNIAL